MNINHNWVVHKFGGTSVANASRYKKVVTILESEPGENKAVVVSAMSGVTNALIELVELAKSKDTAYLTKLESLKLQHLKAIEELNLNLVLTESLKTTINLDFEEIKEVLRGVWLIKEYSERTVELISGFGEVWSAQFLNALLCSQGKSSVWLDARKVLVVEPKVSSVVVDWKRSEDNIDKWLKENGNFSWVVITGFVAKTSEGVATTLKRNGSDFSASIFGSLLNSSLITIWTDVDGVLSADPRLVPDAVVLDELSYQEATELAYFGAKVVHPDTMAPAVGKNIPIYIRNTFNPSAKGTKIHSNSSQKYKIKGFSSIENMTLLNIEGTGMMGVPGVANRVFGSLKDVDVSVVMISQASSEHSICLAVPDKQGELAKLTLEKAFFAELHDGQIQKVEMTPGCSVLAAVGDNMIEHPGIAGEFFVALGRAGVNIKAIAQGSSERNISVVVSKQDSKTALRAAHTSLFLSKQTISIGIIGPGLIGGTLLAQINEQLAKLKEEHDINFQVRGILNSKKMILSDKPIDLTSWKADLNADQALTSNLSSFVDHIHCSHVPHAVIIDCTSSEEIIKNYPNWLSRGIHIITPNKKSNTGSLEFYQEIKKAVAKRNKLFLYETTVGAGLPIIHMLKELRNTGDQVLEIEGILSGTLSYVFNQLNSETVYSDIILEAQAKGYTEPDPRDDLSGMDVARKLVILAREIGLNVELKDVSVESLVPEELKNVSVPDFLAQLSRFDKEMKSLVEKADKKNCVLKYVASISSDGSLSVKLKEVPKSHPFARLVGSDNIVCIKTNRYNKQPLIIQGPGAGPDVTAAGIFGDLLRLSSYLGGKV